MRFLARFVAKETPVRSVETGFELGIQEFRKACNIRHHEQNDYDLLDNMLAEIDQEFGESINYDSAWVLGYVAGYTTAYVRYWKKNG